MNRTDLDIAFAEYDRKVRISNSRLGAIWAMILMPAGVSLDYFYFAHERNFVLPFLGVRLFCSALVWVVRMLFSTSFGQRHYRSLGMIWYLLPALSIAWMIYFSGEPSSPYYAGLNIVLIGAGLFLPWTFKENLLAWGLVMAMYAAACLGIGWETTVAQWHVVFNNLYFLILTGLIVVIASYYHGGTRYREFALRYELDHNKHILEEANRKLTELDQAKSQFFANISHELRTPLTLLLAPLESIRTKDRTRMDAQTREWLATMHANGMRLLKLINDLLDLVRLDSGELRLHRESIPLRDFIPGLATSVRKVAEDKSVQLTTTIHPSVTHLHADRDKLEKILLNLTFNAIKFTSAGGRVSLAVEPATESGVRFIVADTGMGIPTEQMKNLFTRFWQADTSSRRKYQGAGIGLALVKDLVEAHSGSIEVRSQEGIGSTFTVTFPPTNESEAAAPAAPSNISESALETSPALNAEPSTVPGGSEEWLSGLYRRAELFPALTQVEETIRPADELRGHRLPGLLVADDEPDMLRFIKSNLGEYYQLFEAVDGRQAVEKARQFLPDVILCDMMMPEIDGLEVCHQLREHTPTRHIPVLMLTARADEETKLSALSAGASDFLTKPFSTTELRVRLENLCRTHLLQRELAWQNKKLQASLEQLKETEALLVQSEKLASIGRMSAGLIHEINNPLNYARAALHALKLKEGQIPEAEQPDFREILHDTEEGITRVATIVSDLRTFSHSTPGDMTPLPIGDVIDSAIRFLPPAARELAAIENAIPRDLLISGNQPKLVQVFINLLQNALDALAEKRFATGSPFLRIYHRQLPGFDVVCFRDNGPGMSREIIAKAFDPFFTTKDVGKGTGLGLSICYQIMMEHGGRIDVLSEPGEYCEFALEFPKQTPN